MVKNMHENSLYHHGILGQKWGVRRYHNKDGSLTPRGRKRYYKEERNTKKNGTTNKSKKYLNIGVGIVATLLISYAGYKVTTSPSSRAVMNRTLYGSKEKRMSELSKAIDNMGPELVRKSDYLAKKGV